jgi:hypothetical protein
MTESPESSSPITAPAAPAPAHKSSFERLAGVLFSPAETFEDIARKPNFVVPLVLILLISFVSTIILVPKIDFVESFRQQMEQQNKNMSPQDVERAAKMGAAFGKVMAYTGPIWGIAILVIIAAILMLAFRLFGGEGTFAQSFAVTLYAWIPMCLNSIVTTIVAFSRESIDPTQMQTLVKSNPAFLVEMKTNPMLYSLLTSLDIFTIWTLILLTIGFAAVSRFSKAKSAVIIVSLWLATVVVKLGFAALGAARMKA